jgi:hypothetical protein
MNVLDAVEVRFRQFGMRSVIEGYVTGRTTVLVCFGVEIKSYSENSTQKNHLHVVTTGTMPTEFKLWRLLKADLMADSKFNISEFAAAVPSARFSANC